LTPVLIVLDPTPSPRLDELIAAFKINGGKHHVGAQAWAHMDSKAGKTMSVFLERYIRPSLTEMAKHEDIGPQTIQLSWTRDEIRVQGTNANIPIPRRIRAHRHRAKPPGFLHQTLRQSRAGIRIQAQITTYSIDRSHFHSFGANLLRDEERRRQICVYAGLNPRPLDAPR